MNDVKHFVRMCQRLESNDFIAGNAIFLSDLSLIDLKSMSKKIVLVSAKFKLCISDIKI